MILNDDKHVFPAGNVIFVTDPATVKKAGPDYEKTITLVQKGLTIPVMQELDARVDIDKQTPGAGRLGVPQGGRLHQVVRCRSRGGPGAYPRPAAAPADAE